MTIIKKIFLKRLLFNIVYFAVLVILTLLSLQWIADGIDYGENIYAYKFSFYIYKINYKIFNFSDNVPKIVEVISPVDPEIVDTHTFIEYNKLILDNPEQFNITQDLEGGYLNYLINYFDRLYLRNEKELFKKEYDIYSSKFMGFDYSVLAMINSPKANSTKEDYLWALDKLKKAKINGNNDELNKGLQKLTNEYILEIEEVLKNKGYIKQ